MDDMKKIKVEIEITCGSESQYEFAKEVIKGMVYAFLIHFTKRHKGNLVEYSVK